MITVTPLAPVANFIFALYRTIWAFMANYWLTNIVLFLIVVEVLIAIFLKIKS